ncbi:UNVERIFIED_CONTAM: hypothetical protein Sradi_0185900 [Sesamum radiatum]|uniref:Uncharacterized protein n=1 Tax=Sesamum radiatum TaxID=300843 RepID=A0AAW2W0Y1_SESRA
MQEVKASAFSQRLLDGDFFKSLAKKPFTKFDPSWLVPQNTSIWKMLKLLRKKVAEKSERRRRRRPSQETPCRYTRQEASFPKSEYRIHSFDRTYNICPHGCRRQETASAPRSWKDNPQRPKSDKLSRG